MALKEMNFLSAFDETEMKLSTYAEIVEVHFGSRKKIEMLAKMRNLLLQCNFVTPQAYKSEYHLLKNDGTDMVSSENVVDLMFLGERCVVSAAGSQLMDLVHQTLKDACLSSPRVAVEFYPAAGDAMLLYEAIIPVKLERQLMESTRLQF